MPLYEYECGKCGARTEVLHGMSEKGPKTCKECKGRLKRLISAPAFQFKGTGWYVTDYGKAGSDKSDKEKGSSEESSDSSSKSDKGSSSEKSSSGTSSDGTSSDGKSSDKSSSSSSKKPKSESS